MTNVTFTFLGNYNFHNLTLTERSKNFSKGSCLAATDYLNWTSTFNFWDYKKVRSNNVLTFRGY